MGVQINLLFSIESLPEYYREFYSNKLNELTSILDQTQDFSINGDSVKKCQDLFRSICSRIPETYPRKTIYKGLSIALDSFYDKAPLNVSEKVYKFVRLLQFTIRKQTAGIQHLDDNLLRVIGQFLPPRQRFVLANDLPIDNVIAHAIQKDRATYHAEEKKDAIAWVRIYKMLCQDEVNQLPPMPPVKLEYDRSDENYLDVLMQAQMDKTALEYPVKEEELSKAVEFIKKALVKHGAKITVLEAAKGKLTVLPKDLGKFLPHLRIVNLSENMFTEFPLELLALGDLEEVNLSKNRLISIPEEICKLKKLKNLNFSKNRNLKELPNSFELLTFLESLSLNECGFESIPSQIRHLLQLLCLNISNNKILAIPDWIGRLVGLRDLDLSHLPITELPKPIEGLKNLKELNLDGCHFPAFPKEVLELSNLTTFIMHTNDPDSGKRKGKKENDLPIPESIFDKLPHLVSLECGGEDRLEVDADYRNLKLKIQSR